MPREVDLSKPIEILVDSIKVLDDNKTKLTVYTPMSDFDMPLFINGEQAKALNGTGTYRAMLVPSGKRKDKDGNEKSGEFQSHYWYNVYSFEDIYDERNKPKGDTAPPTPRKDTAFKDAVELIDAPFKQPVGAVGLIEESELSQKDRIIIQEIAIKLAFELTEGETIAIHVANANELYPKILQVFYGRYNTPALVKEAMDMGAKIVDIKQVEQPLFDEEIYDYPRPQMDVDKEGFYEYCDRAGWGKETIQGWLGCTAEDWINNTHGTYRDALVECRKKALEEKVYAPNDFRGNKL